MIPATWRARKRWSDRFEDPRVIPIPQTLGYEFDAAHMRDIDRMLKGGNGCAREGHSAFRMENQWDGYPWGGGGRMAQRSVETGHAGIDADGSQEATRTSVVQELLGELPGVADE